jgi:hypothetical protein
LRGLVGTDSVADVFSVRAVYSQLVVVIFLLLSSGLSMGVVTEYVRMVGSFVDCFGLFTMRWVFALEFQSNGPLFGKVVGSMGYLSDYW